MTRRASLLAGSLALAAALLAWYVGVAEPLDATVGGVASPNALLSRGLLAGALAVVVYGAYRVVLGFLRRRASKRRAHDLRNVLRLVFGALGFVTVLGAFTEQWLGILVSLGVVGFAATFALQQPLLSLLGWVYIMTKRPYSVGDRVRIGDAKGNVSEVDFLVTTVWEVGGELVFSNQPSGRVVTVPNSVVLSSEVTNFGGAGVEHVWNELTIQVAYETDLAFARDLMREEADDLLGDEMADRIAQYRERLAETPVEIEVQDRPTVDVVQQESWVELRLRYLVHPRRGTRVRNELYERVLERFNEHPERVKFPVSRNR